MYKYLINNIKGIIKSYNKGEIVFNEYDELNKIKENFAENKGYSIFKK